MLQQTSLQSKRSLSSGIADSSNNLKSPQEAIQQTSFFASLTEQQQQSRSNQVKMTPEAEWLSCKLRDLRPLNVLREKSMINWFRSRRCQETAEMYLHSREELGQKRLVQEVVTEIGKVKGMVQELKSLQQSQQVRELEAEHRFSRYKPNPNPFIRTHGDWTDLQKQKFYFQRSQRIVISRQRIHQAGTPLPNHTQQLTVPLFSPQKITFNRCFLGSLKKVEVGEEGLFASGIIENKVTNRQRSDIHHKIKQNFKKIKPTTTEKEVAATTQKTVNQFVHLFQKDCKPALRETNEQFQMKKIKGKGSMRENPQNFSLILRGAFQQNDNQDQLVLGPNGVYYSAYEDIEGINNFGTTSDNNLKPDQLVEDYQYKLLNNRTPQVGNYLDHLSQIIHEAKSGVRKRYELRDKTQLVKTED